MAIAGSTYCALYETMPIYINARVSNLFFVSEVQVAVAHSNKSRLYGFSSKQNNMAIAKVMNNLCLIHQDIECSKGKNVVVHRREFQPGQAPSLVPKSVGTES
jgi:hypothetical protein